MGKGLLDEVSKEVASKVNYDGLLISPSFTDKIIIIIIIISACFVLTQNMRLLLLLLALLLKDMCTFSISYFVKYMYTNSMCNTNVYFAVRPNYITQNILFKSNFSSNKINYCLM